MSTDVGELGTILSIWAHPDDETYLAGGLMSMAVARGQSVICVSATAGERGTDDPVRWPPERLGELRQGEAAAAMRALGVADHRWLGWSDGALALVDEAVAVDQIDALVDLVSPDTLVTFGADGITFHPDHIAIHRWVTGAWERRGRTPRLLYAAVDAEYQRRFGELLEEWGVYMTDERPRPTEVGDLALRLVLDEPTLDRKLAALSAMPSQTERARSLLSPQAYRELNRVESFVTG